MALKDYYVEKAVEDSGLLIGEDSWAVKYINIGRARTIMEAFDDDASGFITVNEVNNFTRSRPLDWRCAIFPGCTKFIYSSTS
jgi:hypothetical protein